MKIGLALGGGAARGWAHIGIINALHDVGIRPNIVCGTSIGALVGAAYTSGNLTKLSDWVCSLTKLQTAQFFEINAKLNGFVNKDKLHQFLNDIVANESIDIEDLDKQFATVATEIDTGREVWLQHGPILKAVWASIALPGLFPPIRYDDQWLLDGGLVNPVPVSVCRALGADIVIAVNLNGDIVKHHLETVTQQNSKQKVKHNTGVFNRFTELVSEYTTPLFANDKKQKTPNLFDSIAASINITQDRITRSRMAGDPPDILLSPKLGHIGLLEFYRGEEAISEGQSTVKRMMSEIEHIVK